MFEKPAFVTPQCVRSVSGSGCGYCHAPDKNVTSCTCKAAKWYRDNKKEGGAKKNPYPGDAAVDVSDPSPESPPPAVRTQQVVQTTPTTDPGTRVQRGTGRTSAESVRRALGKLVKGKLIETWDALVKMSEIAAQLPGQFDNVVHARHVGLRQQTAVCIGGQPAIEAQCAIFDEASAFTLGTETHVLELTQHRVGEAVVYLCHVDGIEADACHLECPRRRLGRGAAALYT